MSDLGGLFESCPALRRSEERARNNLDDRKWILDLIPKESVGAELGVFTGLLSEAILEIVRPRRLFLVDVWWTRYGEFYPDWGAYTDFGRLPTRVAYEAAVFRTNSSTSEVTRVVSSSIDWACSIPDASLDWAYIDTTHSYAQTVDELKALAPKVKPNGLILGDDWRADPEHPHHGVMLAVNDFVRQTNFDIGAAGQATQWLITRREARFDRANSIFDHDRAKSWRSRLRLDRFLQGSKRLTGQPKAVG